jgi:hypothetical protein
MWKKGREGHCCDSETFNYHIYVASLILRYFANCDMNFTSREGFSLSNIIQFLPDGNAHLPNGGKLCSGKLVLYTKAKRRYSLGNNDFD